MGVRCTLITGANQIKEMNLYFCNTEFRSRIYRLFMYIAAH
jgi:hypothetical protein